MKKMIILAILWSVTFILQASVSVDAYVENRKIGLSDNLKLTIEISGNNIGNIKTPDLPDIKNFDLISTSSSQSTSMQIINGKMSSNVTHEYIYYLKPDKVGKFIIPPIKVKVKRKTYTTEAIRVEVVPGTTQSLPPNSLNRGSYNNDETSYSNLSDNLFIVAQLDNNKVY